MKSLAVRSTWAFAFLVWLGLIGLGYSKLLHYSFAEGNSSQAPRHLPPALAHKSAVGTPRPQLILALHPRCPCSRATVRELAKILTQAPNAADVVVLSYLPRTSKEDWMNGVLLEECRHLNCQIRPDVDGQVAASLGSLTSGTVALYDAKGRLRYRGGITAARGHEGDNMGAHAVVDILLGTRESFASMPVLGCPIR
jgi:hypothetical protein